MEEFSATNSLFSSSFLFFLAHKLAHFLPFSCCFLVFDGVALALIMWACDLGRRGVCTLQSAGTQPAIGGRWNTFPARPARRGGESARSQTQFALEARWNRGRLTGSSSRSRSGNRRRYSRNRQEDDDETNMRRTHGAGSCNLAATRAILSAPPPPFGLQKLWWREKCARRLRAVRRQYRVGRLPSPQLGLLMRDRVGRTNES